MTLSLSKPFLLGSTCKDMSKYASFLTMLTDANTRDETKLKAALHLRENILDITLSAQHLTFVDAALTTFNTILSDGTPEFIAETNMQRLRRLVLEMISHFAHNNSMEAYADNWSSNMLAVALVENEPNAVLALKILRTLNHQCNPPFNSRLLGRLMVFAQEVYNEFPRYSVMMFEPNQRPIIMGCFPTPEVLGYYLEHIHKPTDVRIEQPASITGGTMTITLLPRSKMSLKVLVELPKIMNFMLTKFTNLINIRNAEVVALLPMLRAAVYMEPPIEHRVHPSFNKDLYIDYLEVQVNTLGLLIHLVHYVSGYTTSYLVETVLKGVVHLMAACPKEAGDLRQRLLFFSYYGISQICKHGCNVTDVMNYMGTLCNERILLGKGWSASNTQMYIAFRVLSAPLHFVKHKMPLEMVVKAIHRFTINLLDESQTNTVHKNSAEVLIDLVTAIVAKTDIEDIFRRSILLQMLETLNLKFKSVGRQQVAKLKTLANTLQTNRIPDNVQVDKTGTFNQIPLQPTSQLPLHSHGDPICSVPLTEMGKACLRAEECGILVKHLVDFMKVISWGGSQCHQQNPEVNNSLHMGTTLYIRLMKWGLKCLEIYSIDLQKDGWVMPISMKLKKMEENRDVIATFASAFSSIHPLQMKEVFESTVEYLVVKIYDHPEFMIIVDKFLSDRNTLQQFTSTMLEFLISQMDMIANGDEKTVLFMILSVKVFTSIMKNESNQHIIMPYVFTIIQRSLELVNTGKEPYNVLLFLRGFFRNFNGKYDEVIKEFKPLIPGLLSLLMRLHSSPQQPHVRLTCIELCLSIPVRLADWMNYMHILMDVLVSALHYVTGQSVERVTPRWNPMWQELVVAPRNLLLMGLNTLEMYLSHLSQDNVTELVTTFPIVQALADIISKPVGELHFPAFRILGKVGGVSHGLVYKPQKLTFCTSDYLPPAVDAFFNGHPDPISVAVDKIVETALVALKSISTEVSYQSQCWKVMRCILITSIDFADDTSDAFKTLFTHPSFSDPNINLVLVNRVPYKFVDSVTRETITNAFIGMFLAASMSYLQRDVVPTLKVIVSYYTMIAVSQQAGPVSMAPRQSDLYGLDPLVLCDALVALSAMGDPKITAIRDFGIRIIIKVTGTVMGTLDRACKLPFIEYLTREMCNLCYERAWYAKFGGLMGVQLLFDTFGLQWRCKHLLMYVNAIFNILKSPLDEIMSGNVEMAKKMMREMLSQCARGSSGYENNDAETVHAQYRCILEVCHELVGHCISQHRRVREQAISLLRMLAEVRGMDLSVIMEPNKKTLLDAIPPFSESIFNTSMSSQIGIIEGFTFCLGLKPPLFDIVHADRAHLMNLFTDLESICLMSQYDMQLMYCYRPEADHSPVRKTALRALAGYLVVSECQEKVWNILFRALEDEVLHLTAFECLKPLSTGIFHMHIARQALNMVRLLIVSLKGSHNQGNTLRRLNNMMQLVPIDARFHESVCKQLILNLKDILEDAKLYLYKGPEKTHVAESIAIIMDIIINCHPSVCHQLVQTLCTIQIHLKTKHIMSSPFQEPLVKFLVKYPQQTIELLLSESAIKDLFANHFLEYIIKHKDGKPFHEAIKSRGNQLEALVSMNATSQSEEKPFAALVQYRAIRIVALVVKYDTAWLKFGHGLVDKLKLMWYSDAYQELHNTKTGDKIPTYWKEPKYVVKILLNYFTHHLDEFELLFKLLRALCGYFLSDFYFLRNYLDMVVTQQLTVHWRRLAFFHLAKSYLVMPNELKAKVIECILMPGFAESFRSGEANQLLIDTKKLPHDEFRSVISIFLSKMVEVQNPHEGAECLKLQVIKFACLLVEHASQHFLNSWKGGKMKVLMVFAWPCLVEKKYQDKTVQYYGHLLLTHIIIAFNLQKRIALPVFFSLLKAYSPKVCHIVYKSLGLLLPWMFHKLENGLQETITLTCKSLSEAPVVQHLHVLDVVVQHQEIYYHIRKYLFRYIIAAINFCGPSPLVTFAHKRQAVSLVEVLIKWELRAKKEESGNNQTMLGSMDSSGKRKLVIASERRNPSPKKKARLVDGSDPHTTTPLVKLEPGGATPTGHIEERASTSQDYGDASRVNIKLMPVSADDGDPTLNGALPTNYPTGVMALQDTVATYTSGPCAIVSIPENPQKKQPEASMPVTPSRDTVNSSEPAKHCLPLSEHMLWDSVDSNVCDVSPSSGSNLVQSSPPATKEPRALSTNQSIFKDLAQELIYFLLLMPCEINVCGRTPRETNNLLRLSRRCIYMLKIGFKEKIFPDELKIKSLTELTRVLNTVDTPMVNCENIWSALSVVNLLMEVLKKEQILAFIQPLQTAFLKCATSSNKQIAKCTNVVLVKLMAMFPIEFAGISIFSIYDELKTLYSNIGGLIFDGLTMYQDVTPTTSQLYSALLLLEACFKSKPIYINTHMAPLSKVIQILAARHLDSAMKEDLPRTNELLCMCMQLIREKVLAIGQTLKQIFIGSVLGRLIDNSSDPIIMENILKIVESWMYGISMNQSATALDERASLLIKLMQNIRDRFPDHVQLNEGLLQVVHFVYSHDTFRNSELILLLMPAFYFGVSYPKPSIKEKFIDIFDTYMAKDLPGRLVHVCCSENWEEMKTHFWIKACIELLVMTANPNIPLSMSDNSRLLPRIPTIANLIDFDLMDHFMGVDIKVEIERTEQCTHSELEDIVEPVFDKICDSTDRQTVVANVQRFVRWLTSELGGVRSVRGVSFLKLVVQLCHRNTKLAQDVWLDIFPKMWGLMTHIQQKQACKLQLLLLNRYRQNMGNEMSPFGTYVDAMLFSCPGGIDPCLVKYLGPAVNLWHRAALTLEYLAATVDPATEAETCEDHEEGVDLPPNPPFQVVLQGLVEMYTELKEADMLTGLMSEHGLNNATVVGLAFEQQGLFHHAKKAYKESMRMFAETFVGGTASFQAGNEQKLCFQHYWNRCAKELNEWDQLFETSKDNRMLNLWSVAESAWRISRWDALKNSLDQATNVVPKKHKWKFNLYHGYLALTHFDNGCNPMKTATCVKMAALLTLQQYHGLPKMFSPMHLATLEAAQSIVELQEASNIHKELCNNNSNNNNQAPRNNEYMHILQMWRNRSPGVSNNVRYAAQVYAWRQHIYKFLINKLNTTEDRGNNDSKLQCELSSLQAHNHLAKIYRKHNLPEVSLRSLPHIVTIPCKPVAECYFQKLNQQVRNLMQIANENDDAICRLRCLELVNTARLEHFTNDMIAEHLAMKATVNYRAKFSLDTYKLFTMAIDMDQTSGNAWRLLGEYSEALFLDAPMLMSNGEHAIHCYFMACKHLSDAKARRYLAKVLWLLIYDNEAFSLARMLQDSVLEVPMLHWVPWITQLMTMMMHKQAKCIFPLLTKIGKSYPQMVYFPLRVACATLKKELEATERLNKTENRSCHAPSPDEKGNPGSCMATHYAVQKRALELCCGMVKIIQSNLPSTVGVLENIANEFQDSQLNWHEQLLMDLQDILDQSLRFAFETKVSLRSCLVPDYIVNSIKTMVEYFGPGVDEDLNSNSISLSPRSLAAFKADFDSESGTMVLHYLILKLRKWISIIKIKLNAHPKSFLLVDKYKYLNNFNSRTEEVLLPGEYVDSKTSVQSVRIACFLPHVDTVDHDGRLARRIKIRGINGKVYPYIVVISREIDKHRRKERIMQLLAMTNHFFTRRNETLRRCLSFSVSPFVSIGLTVQLIQDVQSSITLGQIYEKICFQRGHDPDSALDRYYEFVGALAEGGLISTVIRHRILADIYREIQRDIVPLSILRDWADRTYKSAADYWTFRKMLTTQLAMLCFAEYFLHLTRLDPAMMRISRESGLVHTSQLTFDISEPPVTFAPDRPVPFRLTPSITNFITPVGLRGPFTAAIVSAARCLAGQDVDFQAILRPILRDEVVVRHNETFATETVFLRNELLLETVTGLEFDIMDRLKALTVFEGASGEVASLMDMASNLDNLCHMDPAWNPWL